MSGSTRKEHHLKHFDYSSPGAYFITVCAHNREHKFGKIEGEVVHLSLLGELVKTCWLRIPKHFRNVTVDEFVVMPNHFHGIMFVKPPGASPLNKSESEVNRMTELGGLTQTFKSAVTRDWRKLQTDLSSVFQDDYYDHVVRHETDLYRITQYIRDNPRAWALDIENSQRSGLNRFYAYLDSMRLAPLPKQG